MGRCPMIKHGQWQAVDTAKGCWALCPEMLCQPNSLYIWTVYVHLKLYLNTTVIICIQELYFYIDMLYIFCNNFYLAVPYKRHPLTEGIQTNIIIPKFLLQMYHMSHATLYWYSVQVSRYKYNYYTSPW